MNLLLLQEDDFATAADRSACDAGRSVAVEIRGDRVPHLRDVHGARIGRVLKVGRLGGRIGRGVVVAIDATSARLEVVLDADPPAKLPFTLLLALPRPKTLRRVVQSAATLGIARLVLMNSWRVEKSYWKSPALGADALREQLVLGLEQGRDTVPPVVETKRLLVPFARDELDALAAGTRKLLAHPDAATPCPRGLLGPDVTRAPVTLALGPEGGFIERELALFERHGFELVSLGVRPLRVEQAVAAFVGRLS